MWGVLQMKTRDHLKSASYVTNSMTKTKCHLENQFCVRGTVLAEPRTPNPLSHSPRGLRPAARGLPLP